MSNQYPFPIAPQASAQQAYSPFGMYSYMGQKPTDEQRRSAAVDGLAKQIMGTPAAPIAGGVGQLAAGLGMGLRAYGNRPENQFPTAPNAQGMPNPAGVGVQSSGLGSTISGLFNFRPQGGLF